MITTVIGRSHRVTGNAPTSRDVYKRQVVRLDSTVAYPTIVPFENMMVVTGVGKSIDEEDNIITEVTGYSYSQNAIVSVQDYVKANVFENAGVTPGDIIRYGYVNDNITGCEIDMNISDPNQFTPDVYKRQI